MRAMLARSCPMPSHTTVAHPLARPPRIDHTGAMMTSTVDLRCRCGEVEGCLENAAPDTVNRVVCYCDDCQAYAHHLGRADLLDELGGTDVVQVAPASLAFHRGAERI